MSMKILEKSHNIRFKHAPTLLKERYSKTIRPRSLITLSLPKCLWISSSSNSLTIDSLSVSSKLANFNPLTVGLQDLDSQYCPLFLSYGRWCSPCLVLGDAKDWLSSLHVGKEILVIIVMVLSRWLSLIVWCGTFGGRETTGVLKILRGQELA